MKAIVISMILALALAVTSVLADDSHHPEKAAAIEAHASQDTGQGMGMMDMEQMQQRMQKMQQMQQMMDRINKSKDPQERQRLMQEHMEKMHDMMTNMRGMMEPGMMGKGMMDKGMMQGGGSGDNMGAAQKDTMPMLQRQQMMEKRLDMMQGLMEQMMEQMMLQHGQRGMKD
jgi:hypothetical protein